jgi:transcriptional regulator with XRE-family HTH domain
VTDASTGATAFGSLLRQWRLARGLSQARLGDLAEVSTRHVSFMETGRSSPSREMVLVLGNALDLPLRERNTLLGAAGFASVYRESSLGDPEMAGVRRALDHMLRQQEPYGATVLDRGWNVLRMNDGAQRLFRYWIDPSKAPSVVWSNVLHAVLHPSGLRPWIVNWDAVARTLLRRLHRESLEPGEEQAGALLESLLQYPGVPPDSFKLQAEGADSAILPVHLRAGEVEMRLFTMLTTLGTPLDVTAQELRIESYFPADDATDAWIRSLGELN